MEREIGNTQIYEDATYLYYCETDVPGADPSDAVWRIARYDSDGSRRYAGDSNTWTKAATDLATVAAYTYA